MEPATYRTPVVIRRTATFLAVIAILAIVADGAVTLLDVAARASYTTNASYKSVDRLAINLDQGRVELVRAPRGSRVTVRARVTGGLASPDVKRTYSGGRLRLQADCPGFVVISCGVRWRIGVPDGTAVSVAGGGDIHVDGIRVRGTLTLSTNSGDVHVNGAGVRRLDATSSAGDVHVDLVSVPTDVRATSSAGDVHVTLPDVAYAIDASTSAGDTHVNAINDPRSSRKVVARSSAGDVHVDARGR
jgi:hypothetical protein